MPNLAELAPPKPRTAHLPLKVAAGVVKHLFAKELQDVVPGSVAIEVAFIMNGAVKA